MTGLLASILGQFGADLQISASWVEETHKHKHTQSVANVHPIRVSVRDEGIQVVRSVDQVYHWAVAFFEPKGYKTSIEMPES